jgi:hypothetical protein
VLLTELPLLLDGDMDGLLLLDGELIDELLLDGVLCALAAGALFLSKDELLRAGVGISLLVEPALLTVVLLLDGVLPADLTVSFDLDGVDIALVGEVFLTILLSLPLVDVVLFLTLLPLLLRTVLMLVFLTAFGDDERVDVLLYELLVPPTVLCDLEPPRLCSSTCLLAMPLFLVLKPRPGFCLS